MTETPTTAGKHEPHLAAPDVNPSFTKSAFLGEIREELVFPFPVLEDDEKEALRAILDSMQVKVGEAIEVQLKKGSLECTVDRHTLGIESTWPAVSSNREEG